LIKVCVCVEGSDVRLDHGVNFQRMEVICLELQVVE
jgi:hypothetical protein